MNIVAIITARSNSTRLPNKMMADLCGEPLIARVVSRADESEKVNESVVATVIGDPVFDYCVKEGIQCFAGDEHDILGRLYGAAKQFRADVVVRLWGDAPLIAPKDIDFTIDYYQNTGLPYVCLYTKRGAVAVTSFKELKRLNRELTDPEERHWIHNYQANTGSVVMIDKPEFTVDTLEDLQRVREIWKSEH